MEVNQKNSDFFSFLSHKCGWEHLESDSSTKNSLTTLVQGTLLMKTVCIKVVSMRKGHLIIFIYIHILNLQLI
jgi:hypothetical protein